jgi:two-component system, chemotaxis family, chemotaxis protein CheY
MAKTILIVDDATTVRTVVGAALKSAGYQVIEGTDGKDALGKLTGQKINLIITDLNMPNLDGIGLVTAVKQHPNYKFTPIIMLTTEGQEDKKKAGQAAGVKAWVVKPFQPDQLLAAVAKLALP